MFNIQNIMIQSNFDKHLTLITDKTSSLDSSARELMNYPALYDAECIKLTDAQLEEIAVGIVQSFESINTAKLNVLNLADKLTTFLILKKD